jgi:glycosyltransferase involved in cell wall biosynthesis
MRTSSTVVICSNYAWTVVNFRLALIKELKSRGYRVEVITEFDGFEDVLTGEVDAIHSLNISRRGVNPLQDLATFADIFCKLRIIRPSIALFFTVKPVIYGSLAARLHNIPAIATVTGLGTAFISNTWITVIVKRLYRLAIKYISAVFFQNSVDKELFEKNRLVKSDRSYLIPGSGVDTSHFCRKSHPSAHRGVVLFVGRLIYDKGVCEFVEVARRMRVANPNLRFQILGAKNVQNRTAVHIDVLQEWITSGVIEYLGETDDVRPIIERVCCVVLPSYREGLSRVLLESLSMATPVVTTDVPGCRELVRHGETGFLCRARDVSSLQEAVSSLLALDPDELDMMGAKGRSFVESRFGAATVNGIYCDKIEEICS